MTDSEALADRLDAVPGYLNPGGEPIVYLSVTESQRDKITSALREVSAEVTDIRWAVNVLLESIAAKFEANPTFDLWRSDAASLVRSFKHDLLKQLSADTATKSTT
jgi:DNA-binding MarR family transcriptional regulator